MADKENLAGSKGICKYFGGLKAVEEVDMQIMQGEIFGIIGPNGAAKLLSLTCTGIYPPTKGKNIFEGEDITGISPERLRRSELPVLSKFAVVQIYDSA